MKSLCDEILLRKDIKTDLISSEAKAEDFIRACEDFIVRSTISFKIYLHLLCGRKPEGFFGHLNP